MAWALARKDTSSVRRLWRVQQRWALAATVATFPLLFLLDEASTFPVSPVLPGLAVLLLAWLAGPYVMMEVRTRRRRPPEAERLSKAEVSSKYALGIAATWFVLWLVFG